MSGTPSSPELTNPAGEVSNADIDEDIVELDIADMLDSHAELVLSLTETINQLDTALESRTVIGQAVGIVMERHQVSEDRAFAYLVRMSQTNNVKLRQVAQSLVARADQRGRELGS